MSAKHQLIPACDCDLATFKKIVKATADMPGIGGYKLGFRLGLEVGLPTLVKIIRDTTEKPIIYDHQKAANDIPDTGAIFAEVCANSGIDTVILFPFTGPAVLKAWVEACRQHQLGVIVGGIMTHDHLLVSEGGYIQDDAAYSIYASASDLGITDFVVPATRPHVCQNIYQLLSNRGIKPTFYSPGIGTQGGDWRTLCAQPVPAWHAIVGRSLFAQGDIRQNATALMAQVPA